MFAGSLRQTFLKISGLTTAGSLGYLAWNYPTGSNRANCEALEVDTSLTPRPTKSISGALKDSQDFHVTLYQYQTCPFCSKVRAYMDYYGLAYDVVEVNPLFRGETKFSPYRRVPFLLFNDNKDLRKQELLLPDSSLIVSLLQTSLLRSQTTKPELQRTLDFYPEQTLVVNGKEKQDYANKYYVMYEEEQGKKGSEKIKMEAQWRKWVDETLVHTLSPNIYQSPGEAIRTFKYLSEAGEWDKNFPAWQIPVVIYVGAISMYVIGKRLKKRHHLKDDVRISLYEACDEWVRAVGDKKYLGGDQPNLADLATYGVLSAIEGCDAFGDVKMHTRILPWFNRMKTMVKNHQGASQLNINSKKAIAAA